MSLHAMAPAGSAAKEDNKELAALPQLLIRRGGTCDKGCSYRQDLDEAPSSRRNEGGAAGWGEPMGERPPRLTVSDVARQAGVGESTVSRVLRNQGAVSAAARQRVEAAVAQLGYVPNRIAGHLASEGLDAGRHHRSVAGQQCLSQGPGGGQSRPRSGRLSVGGGSQRV